MKAELPEVVHSRRPSSSGRQHFQGMDVSRTKKRGLGLRSWISVDTSGSSQVIEVDKLTMMRRCSLPARDLRLLDPLLLYSAAIIGREKAIVVNLENIRCVVTAGEVLLVIPLDIYVTQYVTELQRRLATPGASEMWESDSSSADLPFEFIALEVALKAACTFLDSQATELEMEVCPLLDELVSKISKQSLKRVRRLKSRLVALTQRVQKVRDEIERLMDDDEDMVEMNLISEKRSRRLESALHGGDRSAHRPDGGFSASAPVSPVSSPPDRRRLGNKTLSLDRSRHDSMKSDESGIDSVEELERLLESYFVDIDTTLNKLTSVKAYITDTEDCINMQLDNVRNQLIQYELLLVTTTFVVDILGLVVGTFGMNFPMKVNNDPDAFKWVLVIAPICGISIFYVLYFKYRRFMPL